MRIFEMKFMKISYMMLRSLTCSGIPHKSLVYKEWGIDCSYLYVFLPFPDEEKIIPAMFRVCAYLVSIPGTIIKYQKIRFIIHNVHVYIHATQKFIVEFILYIFGEPRMCLW